MSDICDYHRIASESCTDQHSIADEPLPLPLMLVYIQFALPGVLANITFYSLFLEISLLACVG
jgi:hypothetical protein